MRARGRCEFAQFDGTKETPDARRDSMGVSMGWDGACDLENEVQRNRANPLECLRVHSHGWYSVRAASARLRRAARDQALFVC